MCLGVSGRDQHLNQQSKGPLSPWVWASCNSLRSQTEQKVERGRSPQTPLGWHLRHFYVSTKLLGVRPWTPRPAQQCPACGLPGERATPSCPCSQATKLRLSHTTGLQGPARARPARDFSAPTSGGRSRRDLLRAPTCSLLLGLPGALAAPTCPLQLDTQRLNPVSLFPRQGNERLLPN